MIFDRKRLLILPLLVLCLAAMAYNGDTAHIMYQHAGQIIYPGLYSFLSNYLTANFLFNCLFFLSFLFKFPIVTAVLNVVAAFLSFGTLITSIIITFIDNGDMYMHVDFERNFSISLLFAILVGLFIYLNWPIVKKARPEH